MSLIYRFLFPTNLSGNGSSLFLLVLRILFGLLLMSHGVQKWADFDILVTIFPTSIGIGSKISIILAIFAELFCSMFFIIGAFHRIVLIPIIITLSVAFFVVHNGSIIQGGELAFIYLSMFILLYITGPGKYSFDHFISKQIYQNP